MNQIMTDYQRELAIEHLGLIDQVIRKRIRVRGTPLLSYEDFYSVGCEALCDAQCGTGRRKVCLSHTPM